MTYYGVYAVSEEGTSMISNTYSEDALASLLCLFRCGLFR